MELGNPMENFTQIEAQFSQIRELIDERDWIKALNKLTSLRDKFIKEQDEIAIKICDGFENFLSAMGFTENASSEALKKLEKALKIFPKEAFEFEKFNINYHLGIIYSKNESNKKALKYFLNAWEYLKDIADQNLQIEFINNLIPTLIKRSKYNQLIDFLKIKLLLVDEKTEETEYAQTLLLLVTYLLQVDELDDVLYFFEKLRQFKYISGLVGIEATIESKINDLLTASIKHKKYDDVFLFLEEKNLPLDPYINAFEPLFETFKEKPSMELVKHIIKLSSFELSKPDAKAVLKSWNEAILQPVNELLTLNPLNLINQEDYKPVIDFILSEEESSKEIIYNMSVLTESLIEDPGNKNVMTFILYLNETLFDKGFKNASTIVHSWISVTLELRKKVASEDASKPKSGLIINEALIFHNFNRTQGTFAPSSLIQVFFEDLYKEYDYRAEISLCNRASEFLEDFSVIIYGLPESPNKTKLLKIIDQYTDTIASGYEYLLLNRMKSQDINRILALGSTAPKMVINNLVGDISTKNASTLTRSLENTMERWKSFPILQKMEYDYMGTSIRALKPIFWLIIFHFIYAAHFEATYRRLPKNESLHHKNLIDLMRAYINFYYQFQNMIRLESSIPFTVGRNIPDDVIKLLKHANDMIQFSDDELRDIVYHSHWRDNSLKILSEVIEAKNYCLYCSFNMPPKSKKCPNCGREVKEVSFEAPSIDFSAMGSFFDHR